MKKAMLIVLAIVILAGLFTGCGSKPAEKKTRMLEAFVQPGYFGDEYTADTRRNEFDIKNQTLYMNGTDIDVLFIGDSITHYWETQAMFGQFGTIVNRGIGGDVAQILAKRFYADSTQLEPKVTVLMIGINNMWILEDYDMSSPEYQEKEDEIFNTIISSYESIIQQANNYGQKLIMQSILPVFGCAPADVLVPKVNAKLKEMADANNIPFVDYYPDFLSEDGKSINTELAVDGVHPNEKGYAIMIDKLTPVIKEALK